MEPAVGYWEKRDPSKNQQRWYRVEFFIDLFGTPIVKSSWGRLGQAGQSKITILSDPADWPRFIAAVASTRKQHGYTHGYTKF